MKKVIGIVEDEKDLNELVKRYLEKEGYEVCYIPVCADGKPDLDALEKALDENTALITFTHVNNESGSILPLSDIVAIRNKKNRWKKIPEYSSFNAPNKPVTGIQLSTKIFILKISKK